MRGRKKKALFTGLICLCMLFFAGCGRIDPPEEVTVPSLAVSDDGKVTLWLVEPFDQDYYQVDELEAMVEAEIVSYNQQYQPAGYLAELLDVSRSSEGDKVVVSLRFNNAEAYTAYSGAKLFYGTVMEARLAGYGFDQSFVSAKDGKTVAGNEIASKRDQHILIVESGVRIYGPYKPRYLTADAALCEDDGVEASQTGKSTYIIMK